MLLSDARSDGLHGRALANRSFVSRALVSRAFVTGAATTWLRRGAVLTVVGLATVLGGCESGSGFRPLYAAGPTGTSLTLDRLSQVEISTIPSRVGQRIRNELIFQATGGAGVTTNPVYRLEIAIRESVLSSMVTRTGDTAAQIYNLDATFKLTRIADKKVVLQGTSFGRAAFERFSSIYSNVRAKDDAENRAARTVAADLKGRLAGFLATN
jgi:LPS-assembly lipoprotein